MNVMDIQVPAFFRNAIRKVSRNLRSLGNNEAPVFIEPPENQQYSYAKGGRGDDPPAVAGRPRLEGVSILIADDSEDSRFVVNHILTKNGARVEAVNDGEAAVETLRGRRFDVVLLDIDMPMLDGFEVMDELREIGYRGPVLAYTGYRYEEEATKIRNAGFWGYLGKPIQRELLLSSIEKLVWMRSRLPS